VGDEVVIIGRQGDEEVTADEIASLCYTISYEILCGIGPRVPRVFLQAGAVRGVQVLKDRWEEAPTPRQEARR
jgi:alanine racemase